MKGHQVSKYILHVSSYPSHPTRTDEFNRWYEEFHIPEVVALDGIVGARRLAPADPDGGAHIVEYDLQGDPHEAVANIRAAAAAGKLTMSDVLSLGPIPEMRIMEIYSEYTKR